MDFKLKIIKLLAQGPSGPELGAFGAGPRACGAGPSAPQAEAPDWRFMPFWQLFANLAILATFWRFFWLILILGQFVTTPYSDIF